MTVIELQELDSFGFPAGFCHSFSLPAISMQLQFVELDNSNCLFLAILPLFLAFYRSFHNFSSLKAQFFDSSTIAPVNTAHKQHLHTPS